MLVMEKFMSKNKTILEKIGIGDETIQKWKRKGLRITYPIKENPHYFKSADGKAFVENADKFVPQLTKRETKLYIQHPEEFRGDFLKNARFYRKFVDFIYKYQKNIDKLKGKEKTSALLCLLYLFQRAMDYHYFHWDRYLVYENYPQTPVGYWWKKIKDFYTKATKKKLSKRKPPEDFLNLLALNERTLKEFKRNLLKNDFLKLRKALKAIKIFEETQQKEVKIVTDFETKENVLVRTGFSMFNKLRKEIKQHPELIREGNLSKVREIMKIHPIIAIRKLLLAPTLCCFDEEIFSQFKKEIKGWL